MTILIGADPELFVYDRYGDPVSAWGLIPGTKQKPHKVDQGAIQVDGVAAEFNIEPAATPEQFFLNIVTVEQHLLKTITKVNQGYILRATPTIKFTRKQWNSIPEEAKLLGCEPDFSAYTLKPNEKPETNKFMRTGSGHIHISWGQKPSQVKKPWLEHCAGLVKHLDRHLYQESLKWDKDKERQELYGKPGAFRAKPYGLEYRTLSNAWVKDEKTIKFVFETAVLCTEKWLANYNPEFYQVPSYEA